MPSSSCPLEHTRATHQATFPLVLRSKELLSGYSQFDGGEQSLAHVRPPGREGQPCLRLTALHGIPNSLAPRNESSLLCWLRGQRGYQLFRESAPLRAASLYRGNSQQKLGTKSLWISGHPFSPTAFAVLGAVFYAQADVAGVSHGACWAASALVAGGWQLIIRRHDVVVPGITTCRVTGTQRLLLQGFAVMAEAMNFREKRLNAFQRTGLSN